jgi:serine phosphatase RsbU (regulator of sigma subunit)
MRSIRDLFRDLRGSPQGGRALIALPIALMSAIATADILSPATVHLGPLLIVAPAVTAAFGGPVLTGLIAALAVFVLVIPDIGHGTFFTENTQVQMAALVVIGALLVTFCHLWERRKRELAQERAVSEATQKVVLRPLPHRVGPLRLSSWYRSAHAAAHIGGDLYAVARTRSSTRLIIGDVKGKGLASLSDTALLLGAFRAAAHHQAPLPLLVAHLEGTVSWGLADYSTAYAEDGTTEQDDVGKVDGGVAERPAVPNQDFEERFVTAIVFDIPDDQPVVHLINCGHPAPLRLRGGLANPISVRRPAPPLGLGDLFGPEHEPSYQPETVSFQPGDTLLLYTDGVSEARNHNGEFFPLAERAARWSGEGPEQLLRHLTAELRAYVGGPLHDDIALVALERGPVEACLGAAAPVRAWEHRYSG